MALLNSTVYFAHKGNPNAPRDSISLLRDITWEKWSSNEENPPLLTFVDPSMTITSDTSLSICPLRDTLGKWSSCQCEVKPQDPVPSVTITSDTYRSGAMKLVIELSKKWWHEMAAKKNKCMFELLDSQIKCRVRILLTSHKLMPSNYITNEVKLFLTVIQRHNYLGSLDTSHSRTSFGISATVPSLCGVHNLSQ